MPNPRDIHHIRFDRTSRGTDIAPVEVTDRLRAWARDNPGGRTIFRDPEYRGAPADVDIPPEKIPAEATSTPDGELGELLLNPTYVPSPTMLGSQHSLILGDFDLTIWRLATGYITHGGFIMDFAAASFYYQPADTDDTIHIGLDDWGNRRLDLFTEPGHMPPGSRAAATPGLALIENLPAHEPDLVIVINPDSLFTTFWLHQLDDLFQQTMQHLADVNPHNPPHGYYPDGK